MSEHNVYLRHFDLVQKPICNIMNGISSKHGCWSVAHGPYNSCVYYILWNPERISYCGIIFARNWKANAWITTKKFVAGSMETNQLDIGVPIVWCCFLCLFLPFERKKNPFCVLWTTALFQNVYICKPIWSELILWNPFCWICNTHTILNFQLT